MADRPNIIFINTDQQRYETINALGFDYVDTPNLDRLVNEGVNFSKCYVNSPVCGPTRASLFSGLSPHNSGALHNGSRWNDSWVTLLNDAGYHCVNVGKMHTGPMGAPWGFHERYIVENKDRSAMPVKYLDELDKAILAHRLEKPTGTSYARDFPDYEEREGAYEWPLPDHLHPDIFVGETAVRWLDLSYGQYSIDKPLFLEIGFPGPHPPYDPTAEFAEKYLEREYPILPVTQEDMDSQPRGLQGFRQGHRDFDFDSVSFSPHASDENRHRQRAYYMANMEMIDAQVGDILDSLERNGLLENSVVMFTSDHGDNLGDHGISQKWNMYEQSVHVPAVVWSPGRFEGGRDVPDFYQWFDFGPTMLELAGVKAPRHYEAISMLPALQGDAEASGRTRVFAEIARDQVMQSIEYAIMVRDERWKCVEYLGDNIGQLFDLENDPDELQNLWGDPEHAAIQRELLDAIHTWYVRSTVRASLKNAAPMIRSDLDV